LFGAGSDVLEDRLSEGMKPKKCLTQHYAHVLQDVHKILTIPEGAVNGDNLPSVANLEQMASICWWLAHHSGPTMFHVCGAHVHSCQHLISIHNFT
jgi:hypothetical protein